MSWNYRFNTTKMTSSPAKVKHSPNALYSSVPLSWGSTPQSVASSLNADKRKTPIGTSLKPLTGDAKESVKPATVKPATVKPAAVKPAKVESIPLKMTKFDNKLLHKPLSPVTCSKSLVKDTGTKPKIRAVSAAVTTVSSSPSPSPVNAETKVQLKTASGTVKRSAVTSSPMPSPIKVQRNAVKVTHQMDKKECKTIAVNVNVAVGVPYKSGDGKTDSAESEDDNHSDGSSLQSAITVAVRLRPYEERDENDRTPTIEMHDNVVRVLNTANDTNNIHEYTFDHCLNSFDPKSFDYNDQSAVYDKMGRSLLEHALEGYNVCLFAYGQTGSGKSYTMMGTERPNESGIIPRFAEELFERITQMKDIEFTIEVSYFEIYNEKIHDLLAQSVRKKPNKEVKNQLRIREHPKTGPYVEDLSTFVAHSYANIMSALEAGKKRCATASTSCNDQSSRSHTVFTIVISQIKRGDNCLTESCKSKVNLVDLAGSERVGSTGTVGERFKEGNSINKSLLTLGKVISQLAESEKGSVHVTYRESQLTWLLKESLGGNSRTFIIATISPAKIHYEETLSTLRYASIARRIVNTVRINEDPTIRRIRELSEEIAFLKGQNPRQCIDEPDSHTNSYYSVMNRFDDLQNKQNKLLNEIKDSRKKKIPEIREKPRSLLLERMHYMFNDILKIDVECRGDITFTVNEYDDYDQDLEDSFNKSFALLNGTEKAAQSMALPRQSSTKDRRNMSVIQEESGELSQTNVTKRKKESHKRECSGDFHWGYDNHDITVISGKNDTHLKTSQFDTSNACAQINQLHTYNYHDFNYQRNYEPVLGNDYYVNQEESYDSNSDVWYDALQEQDNRNQINQEIDKIGNDKCDDRRVEHESNGGDQIPTDVDNWGIEKPKELNDWDVGKPKESDGWNVDKSKDIFDWGEKKKKDAITKKKKQNAKKKKTEKSFDWGNNDPPKKTDNCDDWNVEPSNNNDPTIDNWGDEQPNRKNYADDKKQTDTDWGNDWNDGKIATTNEWGVEIAKEPDNGGYDWGDAPIKDRNDGDDEKQKQSDNCGNDWDYEPQKDTNDWGEEQQNENKVMSEEKSNETDIWGDDWNNEKPEETNDWGDAKAKENDNDWDNWGDDPSKDAGGGDVKSKETDDWGNDWNYGTEPPKENDNENWD